ncbi:phosphoenolpyruvate hydrolase family protein [Bombilactobacillus folatiphilus]|uniref:Phosphoenolpyruvate hydrolase family protein n=1 Tax=Bombilactobacillus folatiphilus TaxID=2923362 RepID=A0ABY4P921_9LACO|nr:phosphoenolpyruvate hydrolase family protein [Bombilactobacillus folatiphilus]UQS82106.1 phosphoenolpyruvate hydrolase family protein [Bombilactobacillus folatiphilus]
MQHLRQKLVRQVQLQHPLLGLSTTMGMSALHAMDSGVDFIMVLNSGKFRQMGRSSLGAYLPFVNSNQQIMALTTREVLPTIQDFPCLIGINATDPYLNQATLFDFIKQYQIAGIVNYPTVSLIDGQFREALDETNVNFGQEMALLRAAHQHNIFTAAFVTNAQEALLASAIPADLICIHLGLTEGGVLGAKRIRSFESMIATVKKICQRLQQQRSQSILMIYGGILNDLTEVRYLYNLLPEIQGYIGGSTFERIVPEQTLSQQIRSFKTADQTLNDNLTVKILKGADQYYTPVEFIKRFIQENYSVPIYLSELAAMLHLTPTYLSTIFKKQTNQTFTDYLVHFRLNKAVELMKQKYQPLNKIAEMVGYNDYAQFNKIFKKYFHEAPSQYQQHI